MFDCHILIIDVEQLIPNSRHLMNKIRMKKTEPSQKISKIQHIMNVM